ncbi:MAG: hypothetical protein WB474_10575 [Nitrososphaeraceae archaeon]
MKGENKRTILTLILCAVALSSILIIRDTNANNSPTTLTNTSVDKYESEAIVLGNPFYIEHYQDVVRKPELSNGNSIGTFTGKGIINGTLDINAEGNSTDIFRNNETVYSQGNTKFVTDNIDVAMYSFAAIGIYNSDGTFEGRGAAVFDDGATGELSSLSNTVAIYKDRIDSSGNGTFIMWQWK